MPKKVGDIKIKEYLVTPFDSYGNQLSATVKITAREAADLKRQLLNISTYEDMYNKFCMTNNEKPSKTEFKGSLHLDYDDAFHGATMYYTCDFVENVYLLVENIEKMKKFNHTCMGKLA